MMPQRGPVLDILAGCWPQQILFVALGSERPQKGIKLM